VEPLTSLEQDVYQFLIDFLADNTYQPSIREIAKRFRIKSTKTVSDLLHALEGKGYIERRNSRSRGLRILGFGGMGATQAVPLYRDADAHQGAIVNEAERFITVDRRFVPAGDAFFVRVARGTRELGILDGDLVLVSRSVPSADRMVAVTAEAGVRVQSKPPRADDALIGSVCGVYRPLWQNEGPPPVPPKRDAPVS
jgi:repressor LexA